MHTYYQPYYQHYYQPTAPDLFETWSLGSQSSYSPQLDEHGFVAALPVPELSHWSDTELAFPTDPGMAPPKISHPPVSLPGKTENILALQDGSQHPQCLQHHDDGPVSTYYISLRPIDPYHIAPPGVYNAQPPTRGGDWYYFDYSLLPAADMQPPDPTQLVVSTEFFTRPTPSPVFQTSRETSVSTSDRSASVAVSRPAPAISNHPALTVYEHRIPTFFDSHIPAVPVYSCPVSAAVDSPASSSAPVQLTASLTARPAPPLTTQSAPPPAVRAPPFAGRPRPSNTRYSPPSTRSARRKQAQKLLLNAPVPSPSPLSSSGIHRANRKLFAKAPVPPPSPSTLGPYRQSDDSIFWDGEWRPLPTEELRRTVVLMRAYNDNMPYATINKRYKLAAPLSTLRGAWRNWQKKPEQRPRKPRWKTIDILLLLECVENLTGHTTGDANLHPERYTCANYKEPCHTHDTAEYPPAHRLWQQCKDYIVEQGGSFAFWNGTCATKWKAIAETEACEICTALEPKALSDSSELSELSDASSASPTSRASDGSWVEV